MNMMADLRNWIHRNFFTKLDFVGESRGVLDAFRPVRLGADGQLDATLGGGATGTGTLDHAELINLDYVNSGHTGFAATVHSHGGGGGGTSDHALLTNLDYASAGHTGFAGTDAENTFTDIQTFAAETTVFPSLNVESSATPMFGVWNNNGSPKIITPSASGEWIGNPGLFEFGDPSSDWPVDGANIALDSDAYSGIYALRVEATTANGGATHTLNLPQGLRYYLTVWVKAVTGTAVLRLYDTTTSEEIGRVTSAATEYQQLSVDFTDTATSTPHTYSVELRCENDGDVALFDNVSLRQVITGEVENLVHGLTVQENLDDGSPGTSMINNGDFATNDLTFWTDDATGWDASTGSLTHTPGVEGQISQVAGFAEANYIEASFTIASRTAGTATLLVSDGDRNIEFSRDSDGTFSAFEYFFGDIPATITLTVSDDFDGIIDNIEVGTVAGVASFTALNANGNGQIQARGDGVEIDATKLLIYSSKVQMQNLPTTDPGNNQVWLDDARMTIGTPSGGGGGVQLDEPNTWIDTQTFQPPDEATASIVTYGSVQQIDLPTADPGSSGVWLDNRLMTIGASGNAARTDAVNLFGHQQRFSTAIDDVVLGSETIVDGAFPDLANWVDDATGWNALNPGLTHTPGVSGELTQDITIVTANVYVLEMLISGMTTGWVDVYDDFHLDCYTDSGVNGTFRDMQYVDTVPNTIYIDVSNDFDGQIEYVSLKPSVDGSFPIGYPANLVFADSNGNPIVYIRSNNNGGLYAGYGAGRFSTGSNLGFGDRALDAIVTEDGNVAFGVRAGQGARCYNGLFLGTLSGENETVDNQFHAGNYGDLISGAMNSGDAATQTLQLHASVGIGGESFGDGQVVLFLANRTTAPTSNPTGGGILYCESGALKFRGSGGTVTTIAAA